MIKITKRRDINPDKKEYFKAVCKCGAEFVFNSDDISSSKRIPPTRWIGCPECGNCIYWSNNEASLQYNGIETITAETYENAITVSE